MPVTLGFGALVPWWVKPLYLVLEFLDYRLASPASSWLMSTRLALIGRHCTCCQCQERLVAAPPARTYFRF
jgi:hypothetical protein